MSYNVAKFALRSEKGYVIGASSEVLPSTARTLSIAKIKRVLCFKRKIVFAGVLSATMNISRFHVRSHRPAVAC